MNITQVKVFPVHEDKLKAFVSVVFDHSFMVNDIKVIQGKDGLFLSMPSRRKKNGEFKDVAHPLNNETRRMLEEQVLAEYRQVVDDPTPRRPDRQQAPAAAPDPASAPVAASPPPEAAAPEAAAGPEVVVASSDAGGASRDTGVASSDSGDAGGAPGEPVVTSGDPGVSAGEPVAPSEKTLEEVQEIHLRDSFWSVS